MLWRIVFNLTEMATFLVTMRLGVTPVLIPNTTVKTWSAEGTMLETIWENRWSPDQWGYSSVGRAPALQAGGQGFESLYLHVDNEENDASDEDGSTWDACVPKCERIQTKEDIRRISVTKRNAKHLASPGIMIRLSHLFLENRIPNNIKIFCDEQNRKIEFIRR